MTELIMIRHGQASFHGDDYDKLSPLGFKQSQVLARYLVKAAILPGAVYCGTMKRHRETLAAMEEIFAEMGNPIPQAVFMDELKEYDHNALMTCLVPEMTKEDPSLADTLANVRNDPAAFQRFFRQVVDRWLSGRFPAGAVESWDEFTGRVMAGIDLIQKKSSGMKTVFAISSGGPVSVVAGAALGLSPARTIRLGWEIANGSISRFKLGSKGPVLTVFNAFSYLEQEGSDCLSYR